MARIRAFIQGDRQVKAPQSEVDAYVHKVRDANGELLLYLYNYKQGVGDCPMQSTHFDRTAAQTFNRLLEDAFGPL